MSGYCPDCGNTQCICDLVAELTKPEAPKLSPFEDKLLDTLIAAHQPEAPTEGCDEHKRFIPHCEDCIAPKPAQDAGARAPNTRLWHGDIEFIEYAAYEKLERELAEAKADWKATKSQLDSTARQFLAERTRAAALVEALEKIVKLKHPYNSKRTMDDVDRIAREALAKWSKHD